MSPDSQVKIEEGDARLLFVADCGWDIDVPAVEAQIKAGKHLIKGNLPDYRILSEETTHKFPVEPLAINISDAPIIEVGRFKSDPDVTLRVTDMGAISAEVRFDLKNYTLPEVLQLANELDEDRDGKLRQNGTELIRSLSTLVREHIQSPRLGEFETYRTVAIKELSDNKSGITLLETHREELGHLLRGELQDLALEQIDDALSVAISYFKNDRVIIDTKSAVLLGNASFKDISTILGFAVIELVELKALESFLKQVPARKEVNEKRGDADPYRTGKFKLKDLHRIETDVGVQFGRVSNPLELLDDHYYADIRRLIAKRIGLVEWADEVNNKLGVVREISTNLNERSTHRVALTVEIGVFLLVAYEVWHIAFEK